MVPVVLPANGQGEGRLDRGGKTFALPDPAAIFRLDGRRALVTGASRGIGRSIAFALAGAGADVVVHYHENEAAAAVTAASIRAAGRRAPVLQADLAAPGAGAALAEAAGDSLGGIDVLVMNAAEQRRRPITMLSAEDVTLQIDTGFRSAVDLCAALLPGMGERGFGRLIAIGSVQSRRPNPNLVVYAAMKAALANLMRNIGKEWAGRGVTANTISPGLIETDRNVDLMADPAAYGALLARIPAGRAAGPDEIAGLALLLAGNAGGYITGEEIMVDGGLGLP